MERETESGICDEGKPRVTRATASHEADARALMDEYYEAVGVVQRTPLQTLRSLLQERDGGLWIAYVQNVPAGCVLLQPLPQFDSAGECKRLYVRPAFRRRGVAEALLDAMETYAQALGLRTIYLDSKDDLQAAIALYRRRGYEPCERYNENPQATVFLRRMFPLVNA